MNLRMLSKLAVLVIPAIIMARYPFIQELNVAPVTFDGERLHVRGTVKVQLNEQAWTEFGYQEGNFYWFNEWWQQQVGNRYGPFTLVSISWTILEQTESYHELEFTVVLEPKAHIRTGRPPHPHG